jgi:hypothetical protein
MVKLITGVIALIGLTITEFNQLVVASPLPQRRIVRPGIHVIKPISSTPGYDRTEWP